MFFPRSNIAILPRKVSIFICKRTVFLEKNYIKRLAVASKLGSLHHTQYFSNKLIAEDECSRAHFSEIFSNIYNDSLPMRKFFSMLATLSTAVGVAGFLSYIANMHAGDNTPNRVLKFYKNVIKHQSWMCSLSNTASCNSERTREIDLGHIDEFPKGEMNAVKINGGKNQLLVCNVNGELLCSSNNCSHYNAPLHTGVCTQRPSVLCPWHAAEFCLRTGKPLQGPGLDAIPVYPIKVNGDRVIATVPDIEELSEKKCVSMVKRDLKNTTTIGIVGGGAAALAAAETLRLEGYTGRILMFGKEKYVPYDRPVISKNLTAKIDKLELRSLDYLLDQATVEFFSGTPVVQVDAKTKTIKTAAGDSFSCDKILIATGATAKRLQVPGNDLKNVETLHNVDDSERIAKFASLDKYIVVVGSSFIGVETAAALAVAGAKVTIVGASKTPLGNVFGDKVGERIIQLLQTKNVSCRNSTHVTRLIGGRSGQVTGVELENGEVLQADLVVVGVGVTLNTDMLQDITTLSDGSVKVNPFMEVEGWPGIYAAGDIAMFPYYKTGEDIRVEHWNIALQQGRSAAKHMLGKMEPFDNIPFFWTMFLGKSFRYSGYCANPEEIVIEGDLQKLDFAVYYMKNDKIQAMMTCGKNTGVAGLEGIRLNLLPNSFDYHMGQFNCNALCELTKKTLGKEDITS